MHIVVLLKNVHDPNLQRALLGVSSDGRSLALPAASNPVMNGYDANALEAALRVKERRGGSVTAVTVGGDAAKEMLRRALALGADRVLHVPGATGLAVDPTQTAMLLAEALRSLGPIGLVLAGRSASDTDAGVVPLLLAEALQLPAVTPVRAISTDEPDALIVDRITDAGLRRLRVSGAAVLCVSNEINKPRSPHLKGVATAKRATIPSIATADKQAQTDTLAIRLERLYIPEQKCVETEMVGGATPADAGRALADRLHQEGLF